MTIPDTIHVLGFTRNPDAMRRTCAEVERVGFRAEPFWNFPTPYTTFLQKRMHASRSMRNIAAFFNGNLGHYSILSVARELGEVPVFVVEDDCRFHNDAEMVRRWLDRVPEDADLALLDSFGTPACQDDFIRQRGGAVDGWAKVKSARSAAAYIVGPRLIDMLVSLAERATRNEKALIFDQWFEGARIPGMNMYCAVPNLAIQECIMADGTFRPSNDLNRAKYLALGIDFNDYGRGNGAET